jgi:hypothetical protein
MAVRPVVAVQSVKTVRRAVGLQRLDGKGVTTVTLTTIAPLVPDVSVTKPA